MKEFNKAIGDTNEKRAVEYLKKKKYKILDTKFKTKVGEIDIIFLDGDYIVFCEVKSRSTNLYGQPSEAVNRHKLNKYNLVMKQYLVKGGTLDRDVRFDVIEVFGNGEINHIINAYSDFS